MADYEKLGAFYLGRRFDMAADRPTKDLVLYDAKDLTTHGICVGMTGSGKTGLCVSLLEEAAIDGIPVIAIDPKGDLGNLALSFPKLRPEDFRPWVDQGAAARAGQSPDEYAKATAKLWREGLASWDQKPERIQRLRDAAEVTIYTPGSNAGRPLTVLRSFDAPPPQVLADGDAMRERVQAAVSGLLALLGIDANPLRSREHILLSSILDGAWRDGQSLDIAGLIGAIQSPPFDKVGVFDLESFYPSADRFGLAMSLNNLLASPGFSAWMEGEALDIKSLLHTDAGKPRISVLSIAHLNDAERMFFVTILLNEVVSWMRTQSGTTSLRAILYMDEVFGYFPPVKAPPSKQPMLTLLKQARAYGLGVMLATQNPVDLDYKGLSNTGTWFIGRLQTERDKEKVLEGLEGASASSGQGFDRRRMEQVLAGLGSRVFLMNNVHDDEPVLFHTRWAMSYLRGPLTRNQIQSLTEQPRAKTAKTSRAATAASATPATPVPAATKVTETEADDAQNKRPVVPPKVPQCVLPLRDPVPDGARLVYRPAILGIASLHFANSRAKVDEWKKTARLYPLSADTGVRLDWSEAQLLDDPELDVAKRGEGGASYSALPPVATQEKTYASWRKSLASHLYRSETVTVFKATSLKQLSEPGESERDFRVRLKDDLHERRDLAVEKLRKRYSPKLARLQERIRKAEERVGKEESQYQSQKLQTAVSVGATLLGALFGRKLASRGTIGRATTAARGASRAAREKEDIERAAREVEELRRKLAELEAEFEEATAELSDSLDTDDVELEELSIRPRKSDIAIDRLALTWTPWVVTEDGIAEPNW